jgi:hypothetical protein
MKKTLVYLLLCIVFLGGLYWLFWGRYHSVSVTVSVFIGKIPQENFIIDIKGERHSTNKEGNVVFDEVSVLENDRLLLIVSKDDLQKTDTLLITKEIIDKGYINKDVIFIADERLKSAKRAVLFDFELYEGINPIQGYIIYNKEEIPSDEKGKIQFRDTIQGNVLSIVVAKQGSAKVIDRRIEITNEEKLSGKVKRKLNVETTKEDIASGSSGGQKEEMLRLSYELKSVAPEDAEISIKGMKVKAQGGSSIIDFEAKMNETVTVKISKSGYGTISKSYTIDFATALNKSIIEDRVELLKIIPPGKINIETEPSGNVEIYVNGKKEAQKTPATLTIPSTSSGSEIMLVYGKVKKKFKVSGQDNDPNFKTKYIYLGGGGRCEESIKQAEKVFRKNEGLEYEFTNLIKTLCYLKTENVFQDDCNERDLSVELRTLRYYLIGKSFLRLATFNDDNAIQYYSNGRKYFESILGDSKMSVEASDVKYYDIDELIAETYYADGKSVIEDNYLIIQNFEKAIEYFTKAKDKYTSIDRKKQKELYNRYNSKLESLRFKIVRSYYLYYTVLKYTKYKDEDGRIEVYDSDRKKAGENLKIACQEYINNYNYDFVKEDKDALKEETRKIRECEKYISEVK